jgi:quinol-cytochrome oxidoreductase complex cytochrome b subunit
LLRFYVLHCMILPLAAIFFIAIHFWRIRKDGGLYTGEEPKRD